MWLDGGDDVVAGLRPSAVPAESPAGQPTCGMDASPHNGNRDANDTPPEPDAEREDTEERHDSSIYDTAARLHKCFVAATAGWPWDDEAAVKLPLKRLFSGAEVQDQEGTVQRRLGKHRAHDILLQQGQADYEEATSGGEGLQWNDPMSNLPSVSSPAVQGKRAGSSIACRPQEWVTAALLRREQRNAFGLMAPWSDGQARRLRGGAIYPLASMLNHCCYPNVCR